MVHPDIAHVEADHPLLAEKFTVIAPTCRGSAIRQSKDGLDMKTAAYASMRLPSRSVSEKARGLATT